MRKSLYLGITAVCLALFPASRAAALNCQPYWTEAYKRMQGCLGGGGGGGYQAPPVYVPPPPSPQELQQRQSTAFNNQGTAAFKRGDYAEAIRLFQTALQLATNAESIRVNRQNIAAARSHLADAAQKRGDLETALREIDQAIQLNPQNKWNWQGWAENLRYAIATRKREAEEKQNLERARQNMAGLLTTGAPQPAAAVNAPSPASAAGSAANPSTAGKSAASLDFMDAAAPPPAGQPQQKGIFGTNATPTNPNLGPAVGTGGTTYQSASAQADAAAKDPNRVFDGRPGAATGTPLTFPKAESPAATVNALAYRLAKNEQAMKDPVIKTSLAWYLSLDAQVKEKQTQIAEIQKQIDSGTGDVGILKAQKETLTNDVKRSQADQTAAEKQIKEQVKKLNLSMDFPDEAPPEPPTAATASSSENGAAAAAKQ
ncbi:MAG TPA: tetratricopeptide repeat protein [Pseudolabrys sp.]|nr:tetratricopeptide repeat protein [Pseudolabrys sp.]